MHKYLSYIKFILIISCMILSVAGCAKKPKPDEMGPDALLKKGLQELKVGNSSRALPMLQTVKDRYPYTEAAVIANLKLADTNYNIGEYDTAYDLYDEFEKFHPKDAHIPYIKYKKAMCNFTQMRGFDRDQKYVQKAREEFEKLIKQFPHSEYSLKARRQLRECLLNQAKFEIYTGNFYFKQKRYISAIQRYKYAINNYPDVGQYHEALEKISICDAKIAKLIKKSLTKK